MARLWMFSEPGPFGSCHLVALAWSSRVKSSPLRAGNVIDLADGRYNKADCAKFVSLGQRIPYVTNPVPQRTAGQFM